MNRPARFDGHIHEARVAGLALIGAALIAVGRWLR